MFLILPLQGTNIFRHITRKCDLMATKQMEIESSYNSFQSCQIVFD